MITELLCLSSLLSGLVSGNECNLSVYETQQQVFESGLTMESSQENDYWLGLAISLNRMENFSRTLHVPSSNFVPLFNNDVLGFLRGMKYKNSMEWSMVAGSMSLSFNELDSSELSTFDYYYPETESLADNFPNYSRHVNPAELSFQNKSFIRPYNHEAIDFGHFMASLDACYDYTFDTEQVTSQPVYKNLTNALSSWGGDLQQVAYNMQVESSSVNFDSIVQSGSFSSVMNIPRLGCPRDDVMADIDGVILAGKYLTTSTSSISSAIADFYQQEKSNDQIRDLFISSVVEHPTNTFAGSQIFKFKQEIFDVMGLIIQTDGSIVDSTDYGNRAMPKFNIMTGGNSVFPEYKYRKYIANSFYNFVVNY
jgi:hypothetical protein